MKASARVTIVGLGFLVAATCCVSIGAPGDGINLKGLMLSPYVRPSVVYDSNVLLAEDNEQDDTSVIVGYGVGAHYETARITSDLHAWGLSERYSDLDTLDHDDFGDELAVGFETPGGMEIVLRQQFYNIEDVDYSVNAIANVIINQGGIDLSRAITDKMSGKAAYSYLNKNLDAEGYFDWDQHRLKATVDYDATAKSKVYVSGSAALQNSDGNADEGTFYDALVGMRSEQTDKLSAYFGVGIVGLESDTASISEFSVEGSATWKATEKVDVDVSAEKYVEPSSLSADNNEVITKVRASVAYAIMESLRATLAGTWRNYSLDKDFLYGGDLVTKEEDVLSASLTLDYQSPADFLKVFITGEVYDQNSTIDAIDYTQEVISAGLHLQY